MEKDKSYRMDLDEAVDKYGDMVYRIAISYTKNQTDAQDIFQETFLRLVKYQSTIEGEEHLKAWLIRVASNCAKTFLTSNWQKNTQGFDKTGTEPVAVESVKEDGILLEKMRSLPEKYRLVLYLFYYEEYQIKEIAGIIGKKENTVKSLLSRGREMLRKQLGKEVQLL